MKRFISILCTVFIFTIFGCTNSTQDSVERIEEDKTNTIPEQQASNNPVNDSFMSALNNFMDYNDSLAKNGHFDASIIYVEFYSENDSCKLSFSTFHFYENEKIKKYFSHRDKMVAFLNPADLCNKQIIYFEKLETTPTSDFPDENSDLAIHATYDGHYRVLFISKEGKLTRIKDGNY